MPDLFTLHNIKGPINDPPRPILPVGGRPLSRSVISAAFLIKKADAASKIVFRTLDDLRFTTSLQSQPNGARFAIYEGTRENDHPNFLILTDLSGKAGANSPYKLDSCITKLTHALVVAGNTLAIEIQAKTGVIHVISRAAQPLKESVAKTAGKSKAGAARYASE